MNEWLASESNSKDKRKETPFLRFPSAIACFHLKAVY
jgi:hypothetical protein